MGSAMKQHTSSIDSQKHTYADRSPFCLLYITRIKSTRLTICFAHCSMTHIITLTGHLVDGLRKSRNVRAGDARHRDATVLGRVDGVLSDVSSSIKETLQSQRTSLASVSICAGDRPV